MAKFMFTVPTWLPVAVADTTNFTNNGHMSIQGANGTQLTYLTEIFQGGLATASAPTYLQLARHSTAGGTLSALAAPNSAVPNHPSTAALAAPVLPFVAATTQPQANATNKLGSYAFNAFGGLVRKSWNFMEGPALLGNTASLGELGINAYNAGTPGQMGGHIEFETL